MKPGSLSGLLILTIILLSCKKERIKADNISNFGFTANSVNYKWDFVPGPSFDSADAFFRKTISPNNNDTMYVLAGINLGAKIEIYCCFHASAIKEGTYTYTVPLSDRYVESLFYLKGTFYGTETGDIMRVTITKIENNFASGTFSGVMHDFSSGSKEMRIWNGYFNRVQIAY